MKRRIMTLALLIALAAATTACQKEEGPMEKAGKAVDDAAGEVKDAAPKPQNPKEMAFTINS